MSPSRGLLLPIGVLSGRGGALGVRFKRRVPLLGRYIADLYAAEIRLVVEVDGGYHERRQRADARRDRALEGAGYAVVHVEAERVVGDLAAVVESLRGVVAQLRAGEPR